MPILLPKSQLKPDFIDSPSVMDPLYKRAIRGIVKTLGLDDPMGGLPVPEVLAGTVIGKLPKGVALDSIKNTISGTSGRLESLLARRMSETAPVVNGPEAELSKDIFNSHVNAATATSNTRLQRQAGRDLVNRSYQHLVDQGMAAPQDELDKLRDIVQKMDIKPKPTGSDVVKHQVTILNKLAETGYKITPEESTQLAEGLQRIAATAQLPGGVQPAAGEYLRIFRGSLKNGDPFRKALFRLSGFGESNAKRGNFGNLSRAAARTSK